MKILIKRIIIISCLFLLIGCGLNADEKKQIEEDKPIAISLATAYIKEKYGIEFIVKDTYGISKLVGKSNYYDGDVIIECKSNQKDFYVWVNIEKEECKDNYQTDEIMNDIDEYLKEITEGNVVNIYFKTNKGVNKLTVLNKEVDQIFNNGAFFEKKYERKNFYEYISYAEVGVIMTDATLNKLSDDIKEKGNLYRNNGSLFVSDFKNKELYELVKDRYNNDAIERYGTLLDESLTHRYVEDLESYQESVLESSHQYKKYKQNQIDNLTISYSDEINVISQAYDTHKAYEEIQKTADSKIFDDMKERTIKQCFKLSTKDDLISCSIVLDGYDGDYEIYTFSHNDGKNSYYQSSTGYYTKNRQTYYFFEEIVRKDIFIIVVEKNK